MVLHAFIHRAYPVPPNSSTPVIQVARGPPAATSPGMLSTLTLCCVILVPILLHLLVALVGAQGEWLYSRCHRVPVTLICLPKNIARISRWLRSRGLKRLRCLRAPRPRANLDPLDVLCHTRLVHLGYVCIEGDVCAHVL